MQEEARRLLKTYFTVWKAIKPYLPSYGKCKLSGDKFEQISDKHVGEDLLQVRVQMLRQIYRLILIKDSRDRCAILVCVVKSDAKILPVYGPPNL